MSCTRAIMSRMRSIHFRVSDGMYILIQQGAEDVGASVAHFCREAAIARAVLWEARRGFNWTDPEVWDQIMERVAQIEAQDMKLRARLARERRLAPTPPDPP
jgi:uncharacterized protein (DUF1778 family)